MSYLRLRDTDTPCRDGLIILLKFGLRFVLFVLLFWTVFTWPIPSLLTYIGILVLLGVGFAVEEWELRHPKNSVRLVITRPPDNANGEWKVD